MSGDFFGFRQHGRMEGFHALRHGNVVQRFVFRLGAGPEVSHHRNRKRFDVVHEGLAVWQWMTKWGGQWQLAPCAWLLTTGMPMVGARLVGAASAWASRVRESVQSCMADSV